MNSESDRNTAYDDEFDYQCRKVRRLFSNNAAVHLIEDLPNVSEFLLQIRQLRTRLPWIMLLHGHCGPGDDNREREGDALAEYFQEIDHHAQSVETSLLGMMRSTELASPHPDHFRTDLGSNRFEMSRYQQLQLKDLADLLQSIDADAWSRQVYQTPSSMIEALHRIGLKTHRALWKIETLEYRVVDENSVELFEMEEQLDLIAVCLRAMTEGSERISNSEKLVGLIQELQDWAQAYQSAVCNADHAQGTVAPVAVRVGADAYDGSFGLECG